VRRRQERVDRTQLLIRARSLEAEAFVLMTRAEGLRARARAMLDAREVVAVRPVADDRPRRAGAA
jgi:hypothetical protein